MRYFLLAIVGFTTWVISGSVLLAQDCGKPPELPMKSQETEKLKGSLEGKATFLSRLVGNADLTGAVEEERNIIYQSSDKALVGWQMAYLSYLFCSSALSDKSLSSDKKLEAIRQFQLIMRPPQSSGFSPEDVTYIKCLLVDIASNRAALNDLTQRLGLEEKYPLAYALFYSDGHKTLYYGAPTNTKFQFDASEATVARASRDKFCISGINIAGPRNSRFAIGAFPFCIDAQALGSFKHFARIDEVTVDIAPLALSDEGVAWVIGLSQQP